jgi:hypothetical protein
VLLPLQNLSVCLPDSACAHLLFISCLDREKRFRQVSAMPFRFRPSEVTYSEKASFEFFVSLTRLAHQGLEFRFIANILQ